MSPDEEFVVIFGALHLIALALGIVLFVMFLRSESNPPFQPPDDDESDGGGNDRLPDRPPKSSPSGGLPLPDAEPAPVRLRSHERLSDLRGRSPRRRVVEPAEPARRRVRI
jgi:hypothetical protein